MREYNPFLSIDEAKRSGFLDKEFFSDDEAAKEESQLISVEGILDMSNNPEILIIAEEENADNEVEAATEFEESLDRFAEHIMDFYEQRTKEKEEEVEIKFGETEDENEITGIRKQGKNHKANVNFRKFYIGDSRIWRSGMRSYYWNGRGFYPAKIKEKRKKKKFLLLESHGKRGRKPKWKQRWRKSCEIKHKSARQSESFFNNY